MNVRNVVVVNITNCDDEYIFLFSCSFPLMEKNQKIKADEKKLKNVFSGLKEISSSFGSLFWFSRTSVLRISISFVHGISFCALLSHFS